MNTRTFKVVAVSTQANSFGLHGHVLMASDGTGYEVARSRASYLTAWDKNVELTLQVDDRNEPCWAMYNCEIPRTLPRPPGRLLQKVWGNKVTEPAPKQRIVSIFAKCSDMFSARLLWDGKEIGSFDGYVPDWFPNPSEQHYGDYVQLKIDVDTGKILNWKKPTAAQLAETFKK